MATETKQRTVFVLKEPVASAHVGRPLWLRSMTDIGPCTTGDPAEWEEFTTRDEALAAPCWSHLLTCWEIEEIPTTARTLMESREKEERTWMIWVCGCEGKVETTDWAYDEGADEATVCGRCKEPHREIRVQEVPNA